MSKRLRVLCSVLAVGALCLAAEPLVRKSWPPEILVSEPALPAVLIDAKELEDQSQLVHVRDGSGHEFRMLLMHADDVYDPIGRPEPGCAGLYVLNAKGERRHVMAGSLDEARLRRALNGALQRIGQPVPEPGTAEFDKLRNALVADARFRSLQRANKHK